MPRLFRFCLCASLLIAAANPVFSEGRTGDNYRDVILFSLIPVVVAFSFIVFVFYRARRESFFRQKAAEAKLNMAVLEMKALRTQINPHFIFNCMNSIHHFMHSNDVEKAGDYLIKFSQLIRYALETSSSKMVPLDEDLDALRSYLELERLRLQSSFDFDIEVSTIDDTTAVSIPPMMLQPFLENSIWHGFAGKVTGGRVVVKIEKALSMGNLLQITIEDNGNSVQANNPAPMGIKKTSMGMSLIKERLAVVREIYGADARFVSESRQLDTPPSEGTRIILYLPFESWT